MISDLKAFKQKIQFILLLPYLFDVFLLLLVCVENFQKSLVDVWLSLKPVLLQKKQKYLLLINWNNCLHHLQKKKVRPLHLYFVHIIYCMVKFHWLLTLCYKKIKEIQLKIYGNQEMHWKPKLYIFSKYCNTTDAGIGNAVHHVHMAHK